MRRNPHHSMKKQKTPPWLKTSFRRCFFFGEPQVGSRSVIIRIMMMRQSVYRLEVFFSGAAERAYPVVREILKCCSGCDSAFGITFRGIVNISTRSTLILRHGIYHPFIWPRQPGFLHRPACGRLWLLYKNYIMRSLCLARQINGDCATIHAKEFGIVFERQEQ